MAFKRSRVRSSPSPPRNKESPLGGSFFRGLYAEPLLLTSCYHVPRLPLSAASGTIYIIWRRSRKTAFTPFGQEFDPLRLHQKRQPIGCLFLVEKIIRFAQFMREGITNPLSRSPHAKPSLPASCYHVPRLPRSGERDFTQNFNKQVFCGFLFLHFDR